MIRRQKGKSNLPWMTGVAQLALHSKGGPQRRLMCLSSEDQGKGTLLPRLLSLRTIISKLRLQHHELDSV